MTASTFILKLFYMCRLKTYLHLLFTVSWMSILIYYMLAHLLDTQKHHHKKIENDIYFEGKPNSLMAELGFHGEERFYPQSFQDEQNLPIFILPMHSSHMQGFFGFLFNFRKYYSRSILIVYNLGLQPDELAMVNKHCKCLVRQVRWSRYPEHVSNMRYKAYLPLLIQETLQEFGAVFWCDVSMRFTSSNLDPEVTSRAFMYGFAAWSTKDTYPTSTFTHYNMFRFFNTSHENFYFHRMVDPAIAVYYNTKTLHEKLMLPWVKCALDKDCLNPVGGQPLGCNVQHKPKYIYAGCHKYDISYFNVIAGLMYEFVTPYLEKAELFRIEELSSKVPQYLYSNTSAHVT